MNSSILKFIGIVALSLLTVSIVRSIPAPYPIDDRLYIAAAAWSPDGNNIAAVGIKPQADTSEGAILVYDVNTGRIDYQSQTKSGGYESVAWGPDGRYIAVGGEDQTVKIIDVKLGSLVTTLVGHRGTIFSVDWNSTGTQLVSTSSSPLDQQIILWDAKTYKAIQTIQNLDPWTVSFSPDDKHIALAGALGLFIYPSDLNIDKNQDPQTFQYYLGNAIGMAWSHSGKEIAIGIQGVHDAQSNTTSNALVVIIDYSNRVVLNKFEVQGATHVTGVAWSTNDNQIVTYGDDGFVKLWDAAKGTLLDTFAGNKGYIETALGFSPYGGRLIYGRSTSSNVSSLPQLQARGSLLIGALADGAVQMVVPTPSLEKLKSITQACQLQPNIEEALIYQINANDLNTFKTHVSAMTNADMPAGCQADLLAVAMRYWRSRPDIFLPVVVPEV